MVMPSVMAARWVSGNSGPFIAIRKPKLTIVSDHVQEWSQFERRFPFDDIGVPATL